MVDGGEMGVEVLRYLIQPDATVDHFRVEAAGVASKSVLSTKVRLGAKPVGVKKSDDFKLPFGLTMVPESEADDLDDDGDEHRDASDDDKIPSDVSDAYPESLCEGDSDETIVPIVDPALPVPPPPD